MVLTPLVSSYHSVHKDIEESLRGLTTLTHLMFNQKHLLTFPSPLTHAPLYSQKLFMLWNKSVCTFYFIQLRSIQDFVKIDGWSRWKYVMCYIESPLRKVKLSLYEGRTSIQGSSPTRGVRFDDLASRVRTPLVTINLHCAPWVRQAQHSSPHINSDVVQWQTHQRDIWLTNQEFHLQIK